MRAGPLSYPVVFSLPAGLDADVNLFFVSDSTGMEAKIVMHGVTQFAGGEDTLKEVQKLLADPQLTSVALDWRLMTTDEVLDYRKRLKEEANAHHDHQEGERAGPAQG